MKNDEKYGEAYTMDQPDIALSLSFKYPLGNTTANEDIAKSDLQIRQLEMNINNVKVELEAALRNTLIQIKELEKVLELNRKEITSAQRKTEEEKKTL